uniref:Small ribosomal subunit protein uS3m n=1 Tax=Microbotryum lychnidis-dioicae TaxID=288795 RepID=M1GLC4_9BASI|nr:ribosomal protein S3 [Microbotryum lychnidis-dioicae]AGE14578.1 ribosomal protein S3 [Microbotryum lychnidis-dioicae]
MTTTTYIFDKSNRRNLTSIQRQALSIIQSFFYSSVLPMGQDNGKNKENGAVLLGKPLFTVTADKVTIQLFYYGYSSISNNKLSSLGSALTRCWGVWLGKGTVELQVIKLNYSVLDSNIFAQYLTHNAGKYSFNRILDMLKNSLPTVCSDGSLDSTRLFGCNQKAGDLGANPTSHITGVKVKLSGRLVTQASGPRQTVQAGRIGSSSRGPYSTTDYSQHTNKNKLGAFTMKVWISQQSR